MLSTWGDEENIAKRGGKGTGDVNFKTSVFTRKIENSVFPKLGPK